MTISQVPAIFSFTPTSGPVGTIVTINGANFGSSISNNIVYFGAVRATVLSANSTSITVRAPAGSTYQKLSVTCNNLTAFSKSPFIITFNGEISSYTEDYFDTKKEIIANTNPVSASIADLNSDNKPDIITANFTSQNISIFKNGTYNNQGVDFQSKIDVQMGFWPNNTNTADINCDGKVDIIITSGSSYNLSILRNTSNNEISFGSAIILNTDSAYPNKVAVNDLNNDGKPDIVSTNANTNTGVYTLSIFKNTSFNGVISFASRIDYPTGIIPSDVSIEDFDDDGKPDIIIVNRASNTYSIYKNTSINGIITFAPKIDYLTGAYPLAIATCDLDEDIKPDVAILNLTDKKVSIYRNTSTPGNISFTLATTCSTEINPWDLVISNIDGDNKPELLVANYGTANSNGTTISIFKNLSSLGNISFTSKMNFTVGPYPTAVTAGDLNGDGRPEIVANNYVSDGKIAILRNRIGSGVSRFPKIFISRTLLHNNETLIISGKDFSPNGTASIYIKSKSEETIYSTSVLLNNGVFTYPLSINSNFNSGEYKINAIDSTTGKITPFLIFSISDNIDRKLWIKEPLLSGNYKSNSPITITWIDFIIANNVTGNSGYVQRKYRVEYSKDNGATWNVIVQEKSFNKLRSNQENTCKVEAIVFSQPGNYKIAVTDVNNPLNTDTSSFTVTSNTVNGFSYGLEWDKSLPSRNDAPIGLAADGTSRILLRLQKADNNIRLVKSISAQIENDGGVVYTGTDMLGKIYPARTISAYSLEGNAANSVSTDTVFSAPYSDSIFRFWLVAPDNFTDDLSSQAAERSIKVIFNVTYSDNSTEEVQINNIRIVRPPVIMVHGLNGDAESLANMKYDIGGTLRYFKNAGGPDGLFKLIRRVTLKNYASFRTNAEILLGIDNSYPTYNSFQGVLKDFHNLGFAANKVDYVCHSMGGSIARTIVNQYESYYKPAIQNTRLQYKNYGNGFINKLITINTPHNGSPVADFVDDLIGNGISVFSFISSKNNLGGFFVKKEASRFFTKYEASPAIKDLRAYRGGVIFSSTNIKNHLIGGDIDRYNIPDALIAVMVNNPSAYLDYMEIMGMLLPGSYTSVAFSNVLLGLDAIVNSLNAYISLKYGYSNYLSNSDVIVPVSSQFAGRSQSGIPEMENLASQSDNASIGYDIDKNHMSITDITTTGNTVMRLLNVKINSTYFADQIPANTRSGGNQYRSNQFSAQMQDSLLYYVDTSHIEIANPTSAAPLTVDSSINIIVELKDTVNLKEIRIFFQDQWYYSNSRLAAQEFNVKVSPNAIGYSLLAADAVYDSAGFTVYYTDTALIKINSKDTLQGFYLTPKSQNLNKSQAFELEPKVIYQTYIGSLNSNADSLLFNISDTNVISYDSLRDQFMTKDTGTAFITYSYRGYVDTAFIYISEPADENIVSTCSQSLVSFFAGLNDPNKNYQWQIDTGNGFQNIASGSVFAGITSPNLDLNNPPTNWYNHKFRCIISDSLTQSYSQEYVLKFSTTWVGSVDTAWENPLNWSCNTLPDENTDVYINLLQSNSPVISTISACRSLNMKQGANLRVNNKLIITAPVD